MSKSLDGVMIEAEEDEFGVVTGHGEAYWCDGEIEARVINGIQGGRLVKRHVFLGAVEEVASDNFQIEVDKILGGDTGNG